MVEVSLIKLPSWSCLQINVTGTYWKSNIGSGALNDLVFILNCRVIGQWLPTSRQSVGDQLGSDRQPIGDRSATGWRLYLGRLFLIAEGLQHFWRSVGNRSATGRRSVGDEKLCRDCLQPLQLVGDQSPTSLRPVGNLSATTKNLSTIDLFTERFHLQQPKPPCDQIVPATFFNRSATSRRPPCNHPATSLRPPEILVARRSPTGFKLCVTGALTGHLWLMVGWSVSVLGSPPINNLLRPY